MESRNDRRAACMPAAEGVRFDYGDARPPARCAMRRATSPCACSEGAARRARPWERVPLARGAARLFFGVADFFAGLQRAARLEPAKRPVRGRRAACAGLPSSSSTTPQALVALGVGIAVPAILLALMVGCRRPPKRCCFRSTACRALR